MGFQGTAVSPQIRELIETHRVGTILLSAKNFESAKQAIQLTSDLQRVAKDAGHPDPLLIATDQENGAVNSVYDENYLNQFPSAMGMAATHDVKLIEEVSKATARQLVSVGVNWILGPVLDVLSESHAQTVGVRSMGFDPLEVAQYGLACIQGYHAGGLPFTCGKHFPNYGNLNSPSMSRDDVPTLGGTIEELQSHALEPFRLTIKAGIDAVMVGASSLPQVGERGVDHAFLSQEIVTHLLRESLGFEGAILSECLEIEAIYDRFGIGQAAIMALAAGCDLLTVCNSHSNQLEAISSVITALEEGLLRQNQILVASERVLRLRQRLSWDLALSPSGIPALLQERQANLALSKRAYDLSICMVRDNEHDLPLEHPADPDQSLLILTPLVEDIHSEISNPSQKLVSRKEGFRSEYSYLEGETVFHDLGAQIAAHWKGKVLHTSYTATGVRPMHEDLVQRSAVVLVVTAEASSNPYQYGFTKYVNSLCRGPDRKLCVVVSVSAPFDFWTDTTVSPLLCTFDYTHSAFEALARVLSGKVNPNAAVSGIAVRRRGLQSSQPRDKSRQLWLVEEFSAHRDSHGLQVLLQRIGSADADTHQILTDISSLTLPAQHFASVLQKHFVVRNSSTAEVYGFVATFFVADLYRGAVSALLVEPSRRRLGIGRSLLLRATAHLEQQQHQRVLSIQFGAAFLTAFPGVPVGKASQLRAWLVSTGWTQRHHKQSTRYILHQLSSWSAPAGFHEQVNAANIAFDVLDASQSTTELTTFLSQSADEIVVQQPQLLSRTLATELYALARASGPDACKVIVLRQRGSAGVIFGAGILYDATAEIAKHFPLRTPGRATSVLGMVVSDVGVELALAVRALLGCAAGYLQRNGVDRLDLLLKNNTLICRGLESLGFTAEETFDEYFY